jgi:hypothetical protein
MEYWYIPIVEDTTTERAVPCGYVLRKLVSKYEGGAKSLTYLDHTPMGGLYYPQLLGKVDEKRILLVEDPMSTIAARQLGINAYCLLGTRIPSLLRDKLHRRLVDPKTTVTLALDADATAEAIRIKRKWFKQSNFRVLRLDEDIKDMAPEKRMQVLSTENQ